jgi:hypothetical protein
MSTNNPDKLEAAIHRVLRSVPDRKAPAGLVGRVFAELSRRAALPWWRKSFAHWPRAFRMTFFVGSALAAALLVSGLMVLARSQGASELAGSFAGRFGWLVLAREIFASAGDRIRLLVGGIPSIWLYGAVGMVAACYATLAGIGAVAYRALSSVRQAPHSLLSQ